MSFLTACAEIGSESRRSKDRLGHLNEKAIHCGFFFSSSIPVSGTISQDSENKLDKQTSSLPLMDRGDSGLAELGALTVKEKTGYRKGNRAL